jgi:hypothetical protein
VGYGAGGLRRHSFGFYYPLFQAAELPMS